MASSKRLLLLTPTFGMLLFVVLYFTATVFYPGGSQVDKSSTGFSWLNNYWCNLLGEQAINGQPNAARPVAMAAMFVLCSTLIPFWFLFPKYVAVDKRLALAIKVCGSLAMLTGLFLFTTLNHDLLTNLSSGFGVIATIGVMVGLYKVGWRVLFAFGLLTFLLVGLNNYVYYSKGLIIYLPVVQKITFALFLLWVCSIDLALYRGQGKWPPIKALPPGSWPSTGSRHAARPRCPLTEAEVNSGT